ncbi:MAG: phospho-sugar mutase, partial [Parasporobacterium sp.]|nr:phospho-sugar mutase [Parasporobacterium sp.]
MDPKMIYEQWLNDPFIDEATKKELEGIKGNDKEIEDRFYMDLEFGTAGLRGVLGAGINRMNNYTVAKATQGLADYINTYFETPEGKADTHEKSVAIACDSRHFSKEFSRLTALVLNANGIKAYIFTDMRPTPELSFAIRYLNCIAGVNITASHNPAEYNGYKAYWSDGAQITPPHDAGIMEYVKKVDVVPGREHSPKILDKETELFVNIDKEVDEAYLKVVLDQIKAPEAIAKAADSLKIVYTPLHGAGITIVPEVLKRAGFTNVMVVKEQAVPDGSFPTVDYPNPESAAAFA